MSVSLGVVGATGAVGSAMLSILEERDFPIHELRLFASARSAGSKVETAWGEIEVEDLELADPAGLEIALFSAGAVRSKDHAPRFAQAGAVVVDNSSAFRMDPDVPLVVAQINDHAVADHQGIIANPNCTTMTLLMAVAPLHRAARLNAMVASSYQSVSGSGQKGVAELETQIKELGSDIDALVLGGWEEPEVSVNVRPIAFNVVPLIGSIGEAGYTDEELKLRDESRKILELPELDVEPTCVRVPVMVGHGTAATLWFESPLSVDDATALLREAPGVEVWSDQIATPLDSAGIDNVLAGRIRPSLGPGNGLNLWAVGDNLRKGAALNAVQIAELLI